MKKLHLIVEAIIDDKKESFAFVQDFDKFVQTMYLDGKCEVIEASLIQ